MKDLGDGQLYNVYDDYVELGDALACLAHRNNREMELE